jgi:signal transduction histidine kinase
MELTSPSSLATTLAKRMREARSDLTGRWLERILDRVALTPNRVFPSDDLLDHMPLLIEGIADYLENPAEPVAADTPVVVHARALGELRYTQAFDEYEILKEYEILGGILYSHLTRVSASLGITCSADELLACAHRVFQGVVVAQQATVTHYMQLMKLRVREREDRLRAFNRTLTHEVRNRVGAALGAAQLLELANISEAQRTELSGVVFRNMDAMRVMLDNLMELSRIDDDTRRERRVRLPDAAAEAARQLRDMARTSGVTIRIDGALPDVEVNAAAVELCLTNLISNAIKYSDPGEAERRVEVLGCVVLADDESPREVVIEVRDNGIGVPESSRVRLFERFFRADNAAGSEAEGTGLGLSIVRETVQALGGRVWAEFPAKGAVFAFALPCRRVHDATAIAAQRRDPVCQEA